MSGPKVLVVEDEFLIRLTLSEALEEAGFVVMQAETGDEALSMLDQDGLALLLTDIQLPGNVDGHALARAARTRSPLIPVIFMTGRPDAMLDASNSSPDVYIAKPYLPSEVCAAARRLTGG
jgi:DNA-binding response OmpR family regulator